MRVLAKPAAFTPATPEEILRVVDALQSAEDA